MRELALLADHLQWSCLKDSIIFAEDMGQRPQDNGYSQVNKQVTGQRWLKSVEQGKSAYRWEKVGQYGA